MSTVGETLFDRSSETHEEIWDDTELIRAYDRAHRQIQHRLRGNPKAKNRNSPSTHKPKPKKTDPVSASPPSASIPAPIPPVMIAPPKDEQDALHSMLMAWYMAGYHAGQLAAKNRTKDT